MDAFDSDVLIYAATRGHPLGARVRRLFRGAVPGGPVAGVGSVLLMPEVLVKPLGQQTSTEVVQLARLLSRLDLRPLDDATARLATSLGATYGLHAVDAVHLATAVNSGADRFITNNSKDFPKTISEIDVTYPGDLAKR